MTIETARNAYALGYSEEEQQRLIQQARRLAPWTKRLFRNAGVSAGQRVLDLGSGIGDVSLILSEMVGPEGSVLGLERDDGSIATAESRMAAAGIHNVCFMKADALNPPIAGEFDAIVGRFILMYMANPSSVLHGLLEYLKPGGIVAFMEPSYAMARVIASHLPTYNMIVDAIVESFRRSGVNPDSGIALHRVFTEAGLPAPQMKVETIIGTESEFVDANVRILNNLAPRAMEMGLSFARLGDLATLHDRLRTEVSANNHPIPAVAANIGAWCRKPGLAGVVPS
jgi:protein-L-isoaspartate O-methyltransferase